MTVKILLVDDHKIVRQCLRARIECESDLEVVGEAGDGREAIDLVSKCRPEVVVMDISMPGLDGVEATRRIKKGNPGVKVVALSVHPEKQFLDGMLRAGASGYLVKTEAAEDLVEAISQVRAGRKYVSPQLIDSSVEDYVQRLMEEGEPPAPALTPRQREVLRHIARGKTNQEIADELNISPKTVGNHRQLIMEKLDLHNVADLTRYAIKEGISFLDS